MKIIILIAIIFLCFGRVDAAIDDNIDYEFINNAFSDPNPTTNQDFENVMKQYETPREGFFTKMFRFFDADKAKYDKELKTKYEDPYNQPKRIKDVPDEKPTVLINIDSVDYLGNVVPVGHYQVEHKTENGKHYIKLSQGSKKDIATIVAREINEDEKAPAIIYGRAETLENGYVKVIYANLDLTLQGYLKINQPKKREFEPILY